MCVLFDRMEREHRRISLDNELGGHVPMKVRVYECDPPKVRVTETPPSQ